MGFPGGSDGKEFNCNAGDPGSISGTGRSPGGGNDYPLQYSCLENSTDRGAWQVIVHGGHKELDMTEELNSNHSYCSHSDTLLLFVTSRTDFLRYVIYWILCCFDKLLVLESFCITVHSWYCKFVGLDKCVMTCVHNSGLYRAKLSDCSKNPCVPPSHLSLCRWSLQCLHSFAISGMLCSWIYWRKHDTF